MDIFPNQQGYVKTIDAVQAATPVGPATGNAKDEASKFGRLVNSRHPLYDRRAKHWMFLEETYEGGREWFESNIFQYVKEGPEEFQQRRKRAYRFNHTREIVDLLNKHLFRQAISRNIIDAPDSVKAFWDHSTRNGLTIKDFSRQIAKMTSIYGRIAIVVDNQQVDGAISIAEKKANGITTYAYVVPAPQLLNYSYDERGDLNWVLIEEAWRDDSDPFDAAVDMSKRYRLWTKNEWYLFQNEVRKVGSKAKPVTVMLDSGVHNLGRCPVIIADHTISDELWTTPSLIDDIAYLDRAVANYLSNLDAIIQDQTFSQLAMPAQNVLPGEESAQAMREMGTKRIFLYDGQGGLPPTYLSPDVKQANLILAAVSKIINEIYHTVGLAGERTKEDNSVGIDNSSGVAKAYDFERVNTLLASKADSLERTENQMVELVCLWNGDAVPTNTLVAYADDFDTRGLYDEFDIAARLMLIDAPDSLRRLQMNDVIVKLFPMVDNANKSKIEGELKNWPPEPPVEAPAASGTPAKKAPAAKSASRQGQVTKKTP